MDGNFLHVAIRHCGVGRRRAVDPVADAAGRRPVSALAQPRPRLHRGARCSAPASAPCCSARRICGCRPARASRARSRARSRAASSRSSFTRRIAGITTRTGARFALPLAVGVAVGRIGCYLRGHRRLHLRHADHAAVGRMTSATASRAIRCSSTRAPPWRRSRSAMRLARCRGDRFVIDNGFYLAVGFYGLQRFVLGVLQALRRAARPVHAVPPPVGGHPRLCRRHDRDGANSEEPPMTAPLRRSRPYVFWGQTTSLCETCLALVPAKIADQGQRGLVREALRAPRRAIDADLDRRRLLAAVQGLHQAGRQAADTGRATPSSAAPTIAGCAPITSSTPAWR